MSVVSNTILIVEDEPTLAQILSEYLQQSNFNTHIISDGAKVVDWVRENTPDLILLDLMLPNRSGIEIYKDLRTFTDLPVIMATAKVDEIDRLLGLELGADDYVCKPYSAREVVVRVKNVLRRSLGNTITSSQLQTTLEINDAKMTAYYCQQELTLTPAEFKLLSFLFAHQGQVFNREQLMNHIYPDHRVVTDRTIDSHIKNLRKKLLTIHDDYECIKSIYGVGYKLEL